LSFPQLEGDIGSPAGAQAAEPLGPVLDCVGPDPQEPVLLQLTPVALFLKRREEKDYIY
jgi:hypothetical protein